MNINPNVHIRVLCGSRKAGTVEGIPVECQGITRGESVIRDDNEYQLLLLANAPQAELDMSRNKTGLGPTAPIIGESEVPVGPSDARIAASALRPDAHVAQVSAVPQAGLPKPRLLTQQTAPALAVRTDSPRAEAEAVAASSRQPSADDATIAAMLSDLVDDKSLEVVMHDVGQLLIVKQPCLTLKLPAAPAAHKLQLLAALAHALDRKDLSTVIGALELVGSAVEV